MAELVIEEDRLVVRLSTWEAIGALRKSPKYPLAAVTGAEWVDRPMDHVRGLRFPGTAVPGIVALGSWVGRHGRDFVAAYRRPGVVISLEGQPDRRLILSVDPSSSVREQLSALPSVGL